MQNQTGQWLVKLKQMKKDQWLIVVLVGILLLVIALPTAPKETVGEKTENLPLSQSESREEELEGRLTDVLETVNGVGKVRVMITLKSSGEKVVEKDRSLEERSITEDVQEGGGRTTAEQSSGEETVYVKENDGGETPYIIEEKEPEIAGIVVVAQGGDNSVTAKNIVEAVMALFGVEAHKIKVMKMN